MLDDAGAPQLCASDLSAIGQVPLPWPVDEFMAKSGVVPSRASDRRRFARRYYRHRAMLRIGQSLPAFPRQVQTLLTYTCDVSRSGLGFLADRELFPQETVDLALLNLGVRRVQVARCRRLAEHCYEVGANFVTELAASDTRTLN